ALLDSFSEERLHRFEVFRRSKLPKNSMKKVLQTMLGQAPLASLSIAFAGSGKLFVGEMVEMGREVMEEWGDKDAEFAKAKNKLRPIRQILFFQKNGDSFFVEGLASWKDLNSTADFKAFLKEVANYAQSLQQVLYHRERIVELMLKYMTPEGLAIESLLNLVTVLARDLQEEFYPYYLRTLKVILTLIGKNDANRIEWIFNCVAYLFKYLSKEVSEEATLTFDCFQAILGDHRGYIRTFGAEALGFLFRKVANDKLRGLVLHVVKSLKTHSSDYCDGLSLLMFETVKRVYEQLNLIWSKIMTGDEEAFEYDFLEPTLRSVVSLICHSSLEEVLLHGKKLVDKLFSTKQPRLIFTFCEMLRAQKFGSFGRLIAPNMLTFIAKNWSTDRDIMLMAVSKLFEDDLVHTIPQEWKTNDGLVSWKRFYATNKVEMKSDFTSALIQSLKEDIDWNRELDLMGEGTSCKLAAIALTCRCLRFMDVPFQETFDTALSLLRQIITAVNAVEGSFGGPFSSGDRKYALAIVASEVLKVCVSIEEVPDTPMTHREKTLLVKRLDNFLMTKTVGSEPEKATIRFCISLLASRFSPLHTDATGVITNYANDNIETFWPLYQEYFIRANRNDDSEQADVERPFYFRYSSTCTKILALTKTCKLAYELFSMVSKKCSISFIKNGLTTEERLPDEQFFLNILRILKPVPGIVEQKSRDIVPYFLALFDEQEAQVEAEPESAETSTIEKSSSKFRNCVLEYLGVFEQVRSPRSLFKHVELYARFLNLLSSADSKLQQLAFGCILTWKEPGITAFSEHLRGLTDDEKFRDFLSTFDVDAVQRTVKPEHRPKLMDVVVRILYGKLVNRRGKGSSRVGLKPRRNAIFSFLVGLEEKEREMIADLMLQPFKSLFEDDEESGSEQFTFTPDNLRLTESFADKHQLGLLSVLEDMTKQFRNYITPFLPRLLKLMLYIIANANASIEKAVDDMDIDDANNVVVVKRKRELRQQAIKRLTQLFEVGLDFDFSYYVPAIYECIIAPRLEKLDTENTQAPSAILELLASWTQLPEYVSFLNFQPRLLGKVFAILGAKNAQEAATSFVLKMLESVIEIDKEHPDLNVIQTLIAPHMTTLLRNMEILFTTLLAERGSLRLNGFSMGNRVINILSYTAQHVDSPENAETLVTILLPSLRKPSRSVPENVKIEVLKILANYLPILPSLKTGTPLQTPHFSTVSHLFSTLEDRNSRTELINVLEVFAKLDPRLKPIVPLFHDLHSISSSRLDEPDFNRRFNAFTIIGQKEYQTYDCDQWLPILHNMVYSMQDKGEYSIRTSALFCMTQFVDVAAEHYATSSKINAVAEDKFYNLIQHVVFPAIKKGFKLNSEAIRHEFTNLLGHLAKKFRNSPDFKDLSHLLAEGDEEANFFNNIYHLQVHRRIRALHRLGEQCQAGLISASNINSLFIPLISHVIFEGERTSDYNIMNEVIATVASCSGSLPWGKYYELVRKYLKIIPRRPALEKELIRVVVSVLDNFHFDMQGTPEEVKPTESAAQPQQTDNAEEEVMDIMDVDDEEQEKPDAADAAANINSKAMAERVHTTVVNRLIPDLFEYLTKKDEDTINIRAPVAVAITKLLKRLPQESMHIQLPKLLTNLCQHLRNKLQDVRDGTRDALVKIVGVLGPYYLPFILRELQGALQRGYQLHILGYTVHSILVKVVEEFPNDGLDASVDLLVRIFMSDIFGTISDEREVQELQGKLKEMKTTKSFDSFELTARVINLSRINTLLLPIKEVMLETNSVKTTRKIDDVLRRIATGLNANAVLDITELMVFIHGLINENLPLSQLVQSGKTVVTESSKRFLVQLSRRDPTKDMLSYFRANAHMFVEFGHSLLFIALKKDRLSSKIPEHLQMMDPLVENLAKSLYSVHTTVSTLAMKTLSLLIKWPLPSVAKSMPVIIKRLFEFLTKKSSASKSDNSQTAFKLLSLVIKDCPYAQITEKQLATIVTLLIPDLEEPDREVTAFSLIRAILDRKYVFAEMYDLMGVVSRLMITSQSAQVRDLCRQSYMQFLLDYPHGPVRLRKQINHVLQNLNYEFESGKLSSLTFVETMISKFSVDILLDYSDIFFLALVMVLINDESAKCRERAASILKDLFGRVGNDKQEAFINLLHEWSNDESKPSLQRASAQVYGLIFEIAGDSASNTIKRGLPMLESLLEQVVEEMNDAMEGIKDEDDGSGLSRWEIGYFALNTLGKLMTQYSKCPSDLSGTEAWIHVASLLLHPHQWIRMSASKLFGSLFAKIDPETVRSLPATAPVTSLIGSTVALAKLADKFTRQLVSELATEDLMKQTVKNLVFVGRCLLTLQVVEPGDEPQEEQEEVDEQEEQDASQEDLTRGYSLLSLTKKLGGMSRRDIGTKRRPLLRKAAFQWFGAIAGFIDRSELRPYLGPMMSVLYRTAEDSTSGGTMAEELRLLAKEIMEHLNSLAGPAMYLDVYQSVHLDVQAVREERRMKRKIQAVVDPEARARRKVQKNEMKKAGRKRKVEALANNRIRTSNSSKRQKF
ncbi:U3 snoRNP protein, partial [Blyttiomyces sp. JEL0837]